MTRQLKDRTFFTADSHFGHKKIMQYQPNRPFNSVAEHDDYLCKVWNATIKPGDDVFHLGDFFFYKSNSEILSHLNGNITLIKGNHDNSRLGLTTHDYLEVKYESTQFVLSHYPIHNWNKMHHGSMHLHGHSHGRCETKTNRMDVGVDCHPFLKPFTLKEVLQRRVLKEDLPKNHRD